MRRALLLISLAAASCTPAAVVTTPAIPAPTGVLVRYGGPVGESDSMYVSGNLMRMIRTPDSSLALGVWGLDGEETNVVVIVLKNRGPRVDVRPDQFTLADARHSVRHLSPEDLAKSAKRRAEWQQVAFALSGLADSYHGVQAQATSTSGTGTTNTTVRVDDPNATTRAAALMNAAQQQADATVASIDRIALRATTLLAGFGTTRGAVFFERAKPPVSLTFRAAIGEWLFEIPVVIAKP